MKYIFIDTNQYRHIFSRNEGFSDDIKNLLDQLIDRESIQLLLPKQIQQEVERNRYENWYNEEIKNNAKEQDNIKKEEKKFDELLAGYPVELARIKKQLNKNLKNLKSEGGIITKRYRDLKSKANQKLKKIFEKAVFIDESDDIVYRARLRFEKGNPPSDDKIGDALAWETLLSYLEIAPKKSRLIFVARDGSAWGKNGFNPWLEKELKDLNHISVSFTNALADISILTEEDQLRLREIERIESKNNAISNYTNSESFIGAGENVRQLLQYRDILTAEDYLKIISAGTSNNQIYNSCFTSTPLSILCHGENGYVVEAIENIPKEIWDVFIKFNQIQLLRQSDETGTKD